MAKFSAKIRRGKWLTLETPKTNGANVSSGGMPDSNRDSLLQRLSGRVSGEHTISPDIAELFGDKPKIKGFQTSSRMGR